MLRLRGTVSHILSSSSPPTSAISTLWRPISAAAPAISLDQGFAVEDYLVDTCGLTRPQALKASTKLSHLKSPANPDAVLAFLAGLGLSSADVAAAVVKDPQFLCARVERTLAPVVAGLTDLGLSDPEIARLVPIAPDRFRCRSILSKLHYYLPLFGSYEKLLRSVKHSSYFLGFDLERTVKPNVVFLRECGLSEGEITKIYHPASKILTAKPDRIRAMVARAEGIGVPRGSGMFRQALQAVAFLCDEKIAAKMEFLKKTFRWSDTEASVAVSKAPVLLRKPNDMLLRRSEFFISEVALEPAYIAHRPVMICYSLEGRLRPRYYVIKFLKAKGLLDHGRDYYNTVASAEKVFMEKFIFSHKEAAPHLAEDYEAACRGEVPTRFRFKLTKKKR